MYQLDEALRNNIGHDYLLEERIAGLIHNSPRLAELFSEVRVAMQNRATESTKRDESLVRVECD